MLLGKGARLLRFPFHGHPSGSSASPPSTHAPSRSALSPPPIVILLIGPFPFRHSSSPLARSTWTSQHIFSHEERGCPLFLREGVHRWWFLWFFHSDMRSTPIEMEGWYDSELRSKKTDLNVLSSSVVLVFSMVIFVRFRFANSHLKSISRPHHLTTLTAPHWSSCQVRTISLIGFLACRTQMAVSRGWKQSRGG